MMDLVSTCKGKLASFRVKELKDVLTELGLSKQGRKQDLVDRILAVLSNDQVSGMSAKKSGVGKEKVIKVVDDTYRKMQPSGAADLSKSHGISDGKSITPKEEIGDSYIMDKIRCPCGSSLPTDSTIMCEDTNCKVWQHIKCVVIPEKAQDGGQPNSPEIFYCEICRLSRADPFWGAIAHPLYPVKLNIINIPTDGLNPGLSIEKTFQLTRADRDMLAKQEYDVQAWCMLLNDKPAFRIHWPQYADLQVNGVPVRTINRPGSQMLGTNGRDDGPIITPCTRDGINKISLTGCDARTFCVGVRIVKRRTLDEVLKKIPTEAEGEPFDDALARVRRCVGGGAATENADSDSDLEVVSDSIPVNLRCPMSGLRMKVAGRFKPCAHMGCFDLEVFVEMNQRSRKWQCPICLKNYSLEKVIIDPYFNRITSKLQNCEHDISEIEVKPDGSWRAGKLDGSRRILGELGLWHLPDGTICTSVEVESKPKQEFEPVKQEAGSDSNGCLKLGIKKNQNGNWEFNKSVDMRGISPANRLNGQNTIPMSSSVTESGRDFVDVSINQDVNRTENESMSLNFGQSHGFDDNQVIVLSDSDEEIETKPRISPGTVSPPEQQSRVISNSYNENPSFINGGNSSIDLCSPNGEFGINTWSLLSTSQEGAGFQCLGSDMDRPIQCSTSVNGSTGVASATCVEDSELNAELVDNPLVLNGEDPSLKIFLPAMPSDGPGGQAGMRERRDVLDGDGWMSLKLANDGASDRGDSNGLNSIPDIPPKDSAPDSLADIALRGMNSDVNSNRPVNGNGKTSREGSGSPFTFPRQRRSVKPRLYLSIDLIEEAAAD